MSCIPALQKHMESNNPLYLSEGIVFEGAGNYKGYDFCVTLVSNLGNRCGYVAIPATHPAYKSDGLHELDVYDGISADHMPAPIAAYLERSGMPQCSDQWIGFAPADPYADLPDMEAMERYFPATAGAMTRFTAKHGHLNPDASIKNVDFMINECKRLIDQLEAWPDSSQVA